MAKKSAIAIFAHPDDIEFVAAGTLLLLKQAGWEIHYLNLSSGSLGSTITGPDDTRRIRAQESRAAAKLLGAHYHPSFCDDLEIFYNSETLRELAAVIRKAEADMVLTHSPQDYMEDHMNTCRLAVTAAFTKGMPNFHTEPPLSHYEKDVTVYHAMPHGLRDPLRRRIIPGIFVDSTSVHETKRAALACHASQKEWLDASQGMDSYLVNMDEMSREIGRMSGRFTFAEGWRRHLHLGFSSEDRDPLAEVLGDNYLLNRDYENALEQGL